MEEREGIEGWGDPRRDDPASAWRLLWWHARLWHDHTLCVRFSAPYHVPCYELGDLIMVFWYRCWAHVVFADPCWWFFFKCFFDFFDSAGTTSRGFRCPITHKSMQYRIEFRFVCDRCGRSTRVISFILTICGIAKPPRIMLFLTVVFSCHTKILVSMTSLRIGEICAQAPNLSHGVLYIATAFQRRGAWESSSYFYGNHCPHKSFWVVLVWLGPLTVIIFCIILNQ